MVVLAKQIARYRELLLKDPESRVYVPLADLLQQNGEFEEALVLLEDGLSRNPGHQAAMVVLGYTLLRAGRPDHGVKVLQRVLDLSPDNFVVLRALVKNFLLRDAFTHALPLLERLVELEPEQEEWPKLLGDVRERMAVGSKLDRPRTTPSTVPSTKPSTKSSTKPLTTPGPPATSPSSTEQPTVKTNANGLATMTLVDIMVAQGYLDKALNALKRMLEVHPDREDVILRISQLKESMAAPRDSGKKSVDNGKVEFPTGEARIKMRQSQKKQFGDWIENFNHEEDTSS